MRSLINLSSYTKSDIYEIFTIADEIQLGKYQDILKGKTVILFFPNSSIRTRITYERGIYLLGGQSILFPTETLDKKELLKDVCGYINNWADIVIARHKNMDVLESLGNYLSIPAINAMTDSNHPCEIISDMYSLSKIRDNFINDKYLYCGTNSNIGLTWKAASDIMGLELEQCCGVGYEIDGIKTYHNIEEAIVGKDIICTDSLPSDALSEFSLCQITESIMKKANKGAILNPCPPFYRGEEVSCDAISSSYFVGYAFKKFLLEVQQAIMIYCLTR